MSNRNPEDKNLKLISRICNEVNEKYDSSFKQEESVKDDTSKKVRSSAGDLYGYISETERGHRINNEREGLIDQQYCKIFKLYERAKRSGSVISQEAFPGTSPTGGFNNSVMIHSGEFFWEEEDLKMESRLDMGLKFRRFYRSMVRYEGPLGYGWDHNFNQRIYCYENKLLYVQASRSITFTKIGDKYFPEEGAYYDLEYGIDAIVIRTKNNIELHFEKALSKDCYRIAGIQDSNHKEGDFSVNKISFIYHKNTDFLKEVKDVEDRVLEFKYHNVPEKAGLIRTIKFKSLEFQYDYEQINNFWVLKTVSIPPSFYNISKTQSRIENKYEKRYEYVKLIGKNAEPLLTTIIDSENNLQCLNFYQANDRDPWFRSVEEQLQISKQELSERHFIPEEKATYKIISRSTQQSLSLHSSSDQNQKPICLSSFANSENQLWEFVKDKEGYYFIKSHSNNKCLDVRGAEKGNGTIIQQYDKAGVENQKWKVETSGNGFLYIKAKHSLKVIDVREGASGGEIQQFEMHNGSSCEWLIIKVDSKKDESDTRREYEKFPTSSFDNLPRWQFHSEVSQGDDYYQNVTVFTPDLQKGDDLSGYNYHFDIVDHKIQNVPAKIFRPGSGNPITYSYNKGGEVVKCLYPNGNIEQFQFDEKNKKHSCRNNLLKHIKSNTNSSLSTHGYKTITNAFYYDKITDLLKREEVLEDQKIIYSKQYERDPKTGDVTKLTEGEEHQVICEYKYNIFGQLTSEGDPNGVVKEYIYKNTSKQYEGGGPVKKVIHGKKASQSDHILDLEQNTYTEEFRYDDLGYMSEYSQGKKKISFINNMFGMRLLEFDGEGVPVFRNFNSIGHLISEIRLVNFRSATELYNRFLNTEISAISSSLLLEMGEKIFNKQLMGLELNKNSVKVTSYSYFLNGRLRRKLIGDYSGGPEVKKIDYEYYDNGQIKIKVLPSGLMVFHEPSGNTDRPGRVYIQKSHNWKDQYQIVDSPFENITSIPLHYMGTLSKNISEKDFSVAELNKFKYDNNFNIVEEQKDGVLTEYIFDEFDRKYQTWKGGRYLVEEKLSGREEIVSRKFLTKSMHDETDGLEESDRMENFIFSDSGRLISKKTRIEQKGTPSYFQESFVYDCGGRLTKVNHNRLDDKTMIYYDQTGREIASINSEGRGTVKVFRGHDLIASVQVLESVKDLICQTETYFYDRNGRVVRKALWKNNLEPDNHQNVAYSYDTEGRVVKEINNLGSETLYVYDVFSQLIRKEIYDKKNHKEHPDSKGYEYFYGPNGELTKYTLKVHPLRLENSLMIAEDIKEWNFTYDTFGRIVEEADPDGLYKEYEYDESSRVNILNIKNKLKGDEPRKKLKIEYDELKRANKIYDKNFLLQEIQYDSFNNITEASQYYESLTGTLDNDVPNKIKNERSYNGLNDLIAESTTLFYANKKEAEKADQKSLNYFYDYKKGIVTTEFPLREEKGDNFWSNEIREFDLSGNLTTVKSDPFMVKYDSRGGLVRSRGYNDLTRGAAVCRIRTSYEYNSFNQLSNLLIRQDNRNDYLKLSYEYEKNSQLIEQNTIDFSWKNKDRHHKLKRLKFYKNDGHGRLIFSSSQDVLHGDAEYENHIRESFSKFQKGYSLVSLGYYFDYDESDNMNALSNGSYTLDHISKDSQKVKVTKTGSRIHDKSTFFYINDLKGLSDRLKFINNYDSNIIEFSYDDLGRVQKYQGTIEVPQGELSVRWNYEFDVLNHLTKALANDSKTKNERVVYYRYDFWGRRIFKMIKDQIGNLDTQKYLSIYDRNNLVLDYEYSPNAGWQPLAEYLWGFGEHEILLANLPNKKIRPDDDGFTKYWMFQDATANVVLSAFRTEGNDFNVIDLQDFMNFGDANNKAEIDEIITNLKNDPNFEGTADSKAYENAIDPNLTKSWKLMADKGQIDIVFSKETKISEIKIFASRFWDDFKVFLFPEEALNELDKDLFLEESKLINFNSKNSAKYKLNFVKDALRDKEDPTDWISIMCNNQKTKRIVLVSEERKRLEIENISFLVPRTEIHDFGFAGARFDSETGLYYHEARYRLPEMQSKFLSPDPLGFLITGNHYAYAENNPVSLYDPDGRIFNFALAAIGAGVGAVIGAASYGAKVIFTDEEFDWRDFAVHTGTGFVAGGLAGFTGGASLALTAQMGATATTGSMIAGGAAGFVGGGINSGAIKGYETYKATGDFNRSISEGLSAGLTGAVAGAIGGVAGGAVLGEMGANMSGFIASGAAGGAAAGAVGGGIQGYMHEGTISGVLTGAGKGLLIGAVGGAAAGALAFGVANLVAGRLPGMEKLSNYPKDLPEPKGLLVKTTPGNRSFGGYEVTPGYARHHITPLSLGGSNAQSNVTLIPSHIHMHAHPPYYIRELNFGTIFIF